MFNYQSCGSSLLIKVTETRLCDEFKAELFRLEIDRLVQDRNASLVVVDLSDVQIISSVMIGALVRLRNKLMCRGVRFRQCGVPPAVESAYRTANLIGTVFSIYQTPDAALGHA